MQVTHPMAHPKTFTLERALAVFLFLHAIAHLVGTQASFVAADEGKTLAYLGGAWDVSDPTVLRLLGVAWAVVGVLTIVAAWAFWVGSPRRVTLLVVATVPSLILAIAALWMAVVGVVIDVVLLGLAAWMTVAKRRGTS